MTDVPTSTAWAVLSCVIAAGIQVITVTLVVVVRVVLTAILIIPLALLTGKPVQSLRQTNNPQNDPVLERSFSEVFWEVFTGGHLSRIFRHFTIQPRQRRTNRTTVRRPLPSSVSQLTTPNACMKVSYRSPF